MPESTIHDHMMPSNAVGSVMRIRVVTPPGYDPAQEYPVLYLLHLWGSHERFWTDRLAVHARLEEGIAAGTLPPMIIAMPQGDKSFYINAADPPGIIWEDSPHNDASEYFYDGFDCYGNYGDYLLKEAIPYVEEHYPVRTDRAGRAIGGLSMGAAGAAVHAFTDPGRFCAVGMHGLAVFYREDGPGAPPWIFGIDDEDAFARRDPSALAGRFVTRKNQPRIWVDCGWDDPLRANVEIFHDALLEMGLAHDYHIWPGGHDGAYWSQYVSDYLRFYARGW
ncbi:MAG: esterase family protein [Anaerolineae bacterium]|nr:esterase family protein [Anaerolineae bacterium]